MKWGVGFARMSGNSADLLIYSAKRGLYSANFASYSAETAINSAKLLLVTYFKDCSDLDRSYDRGYEPLLGFGRIPPG
jgi:hypothetical protein